MVREEQKEDFNLILLGLCAVVKVINSQNRKVNVEKVRELTQEVHLKIVRCFPWAVLSPSVQRVHAHSWKVIELNDGFGLGDMSEEGLKALNKQIRESRITVPGRTAPRTTLLTHSTICGTGPGQPMCRWRERSRGGSQR